MFKFQRSLPLGNGDSLNGAVLLHLLNSLKKKKKTGKMFARASLSDRAD